MKGKKGLRSFGVAVLVLSAAVWTACGGSSGSTTPEDTGTITTNEQAMASIPTGDPTELDYSLQDEASAMIVKALGIKEDAAGSGALEGKVVLGAAVGEATIFLCLNDTLIGWAQMSYANGVFTEDARVSMSSDKFSMTGTLPMKAITESDFSGNATFIMDGSKGHGVIVLSAEGATQTNTMQGSLEKGGGIGKAVCHWNRSLGCAKFLGQEQVEVQKAFSITVDAATKAKSYAASTDESMCPGLPAYQDTVPDAAVPPAGGWDCVIPDTLGANERLIQVASASALEDKGGTVCLDSASNHWRSLGDTDVDSDRCFAGGGAPDGAVAGCFCDSIFAFGAMIHDAALRPLICKIRGIFGDTALSAEAPANGITYFSVGGVGDIGGSNFGGGGGGGDVVDGCHCTAFCTTMDASPAPDDMVAACNACCAAGTGVEACLTNACMDNANCVSGVAQACP